MLFNKERGHCRTLSDHSEVVKSESSCKSVPNSEYEKMIQKFEADIRNHIKIEQQMKLHSDSVIDKLEDKEKECDKLEK